MQGTDGIDFYAVTTRAPNGTLVGVVPATVKRRNGPVDVVTNSKENAGRLRAPAFSLAGTAFISASNIVLACADE